MLTGLISVHEGFLDTDKILTGNIQRIILKRIGSWILLSGKDIRIHAGWNWIRDVKSN